MNRLTILDNIQIASPCEVPWSRMAGDDRTRFCDSCSKHVYNISWLTADEATKLIQETKGDLCLRIYRRADGTVLTADCPVGLAKISIRQRVRLAMSVVMLIPAFGLVALSQVGLGRRNLMESPTGPGVTWNDRLAWAMSVLGLNWTTTRFSSVSGAMPRSLYQTTAPTVAPSAAASLSLPAEPTCPESIPVETPIDNR